MTTRTASLLVLAAMATAGCGDSSGPSRLTATDVGGTYQICSLVFTPEGGTPPAVDILAAATQPGGVRELRVGQTGSQFQLEYTRKGDVIRPRIEGTYSTSTRGITLIPSSGEFAALLLPSRIEADFQASTRSLVISSPSYQVTRTNYEALSGQRFPTVRDQFNGTLAGRFSQSGC